MTLLCALTLHRVKILYRSRNQGNVGASWKSHGTRHPAVYSVGSTTGILTEQGAPGRTHETHVPVTQTSPSVGLLLLSLLLLYFANYFSNIACLICWMKSQNFASSPCLQHRLTACSVFCVGSPQTRFNQTISNDLLIVRMKSKTKDNFRTAAMFYFTF